MKFVAKNIRDSMNPKYIWVGKANHNVFTIYENPDYTFYFTAEKNGEVYYDSRKQDRIFKSRFEAENFIERWGR